MAGKTFAPTAEDVFNRVAALFEYLQSGILVNEVRQGYDSLHGSPLLSAVVPYITQSLYIDTPNREVTFAALQYPRDSGCETQKYYVLLHEELDSCLDNTVIAECSGDEYDRAVRLIHNILAWYEDHIDEIRATKVEVLQNLYKMADDSSREVIRKAIDSLSKVC